MRKHTSNREESPLKRHAEETSSPRRRLEAENRTSVVGRTSDEGRKFLFPKEVNAVADSVISGLVEKKAKQQQRNLLDRAEFSTFL